MRNVFEIKRVVFYGWVALPFLIIWTWHISAAYEVTLPQAVLDNCWRMLYIVPLNFIFFEYVIPFVLRKRRWLLSNVLLSAASLFICMLLWSYGLFAWRSLGVTLNIYTALGNPTARKEILTSQMAFSVASVVFFGVIRHIYQYVKLQRAEQQLRIEKQAAELNYLRAQTNPHFLFNTLNNIYSLARDKSDLAAESILRLSKILRFMLYETAVKYINIEQEMKIIDDYIALERLRYSNELRITITHDIEDQQQAIHPLLLIPLVENAFKHGVSETRDHPFINIHLAVNNRHLSFIVQNSAEKSKSAGNRENIGLSNLRRQLELLYLDHALSVEQTDSAFTATLKINLASHA